MPAHNKREEVPFIIVVVMTFGEFGFAAFLAFSHGDVFPIYLATLYFIRERWSGYHFMAEKLKEFINSGARA